MKKACLRLLTTAVFLGGVGCGDELPQITDIEGVRVLGARHSVVGDDSLRATAEEGESVEVAFQLVSPDPLRSNRNVASIFIDCTWPDRFTGLPLCQEFFDLAALVDPNAPAPTEEDLEAIKCFEDNEFIFEGVHGSCVIGDPTVEVPVFRGSDPLKLVRGVICERGTPFFDARTPALFGCDLREGGSEHLVHGSVPVAVGGGVHNDNPDFAEIRLALNGRPWEAMDPAALPEADNCMDAVTDTGLLAIDAFEHELSIELDADSAIREEVEGVREDLEFSLYTSGGEVGRRFTVFEGTDPGEDGVLEATVPWDAPETEDLPDGGQLVTLYLTMLDRRGGFDMAVRHACVFAAKAL